MTPSQGIDKARALTVDARSMMARITDEAEERPETQWLVPDLDEVRAILSDLTEALGSGQNGERDA